MGKLRKIGIGAGIIVGIFFALVVVAVVASMNEDGAENFTSSESEQDPPEVKSYPTDISYKELQRFPDKYKGTLIEFEGCVVYTFESDDDTYGVIAVVPTHKNCDEHISSSKPEFRVRHDIDKEQGRILVDDRVIVVGEFDHLWSNTHRTDVPSIQSTKVLIVNKDMIGVDVDNLRGMINNSDLTEGLKAAYLDMIELNCENNITYLQSKAIGKLAKEKCLQTIEEKVKESIAADD